LRAGARRKRAVACCAKWRNRRVAPKEGREPKDSPLRPAPPMIARLRLPPLAPQSSKGTPGLLPLPRLPSAAPLLPTLRLPPWRNRPLCSPGRQGFITLAVVRCPLSPHWRNRTLAVVPHVGSPVLSGDAGLTDHRCHACPRGGRHSYMELVPRAPLAPARWSHLPLAFAIALDPPRREHALDGACSGPSRESARTARPPPRQRPISRDRATPLHHPKPRSCQPLGRA
jgi:hypothetical protein